MTAEELTKAHVDRLESLLVFRMKEDQYTYDQAKSMCLNRVTPRIGELREDSFGTVFEVTRITQYVHIRAVWGIAHSAHILRRDDWADFVFKGRLRAHDGVFK